MRNQAFFAVLLVGVVSSTIAHAQTGIVADPNPPVPLVPNSDDGQKWKLCTPPEMIGSPNKESVIDSSKEECRQIAKPGLHQGMRSDSVMWLQRVLQMRGLLSQGGVTGFFGPLTFGAIRDFQKARNLPRTGFVGPLTIQALSQIPVVNAQ